MTNADQPPSGVCRHSCYVDSAIHAERVTRHLWFPPHHPVLQCKDKHLRCPTCQWFLRFGTPAATKTALIYLTGKRLKQVFLPRSPAPAGTSHAGSRMARGDTGLPVLPGRERGRRTPSHFREPSAPVYAQSSSGRCGQSRRGCQSPLQNTTAHLCSCGTSGSFGTSCSVSTGEASHREELAWDS